MKETRSHSDALFYHPETGELLNGLAQSLLSNDGRLEYPDPVPMAAPVNLYPPASGMRRLVQEMIRQEMSELAESMEMETFEEADDFDIEDDPLDPLTEYERVFDPKDEELSRRTASSGADGNGEPQVTAGEKSPREDSRESESRSAASGGSAGHSDGVAAARGPAT